MKTFKPPYTAQGDLNIFLVESIPSGLGELDANKDGQHVLAHSETGHHHIIDGNTVRVFDESEFVSYLDVQEESNVVHMRDFHTHETIALPPGQYKITRQREYVPEGYRRAAD